MSRGQPGLETLVAGGLGDEVHTGKAIAADVGGRAVVIAGATGHQVQFGTHARHGVDLAAKLRDPKGVHDCVGGDFKVYGSVDGDVQLVDAGYTLGRIKEQPLPVEGDDLDSDGWLIADKRLVGIEGVAAIPGSDSQHQDN